MKVPPAQDPIWEALFKGEAKGEPVFLAAKIFLGWARLFAKNNPSAAPKLIKELQSLYEKNAGLPSVQQDLSNLT